MIDSYLEKYTEIHLEGSPTTGWWATCSALPDQAWQDVSLERLISRIQHCLPSGQQETPCLH